QPANQITERAPVGVRRAVARCGGAEGRERWGRITSRRREGEAIGRRRSDPGQRLEAGAGLQSLRDGARVLGGGTTVGPAPPPDGAPAPAPPGARGRPPWGAGGGGRRPAPPPPAIAATTAAATLAGLGDGELAAADLVAVQLLDGALGLLGRTHLDEAE